MHLLYLTIAYFSFEYSLVNPNPELSTDILFNSIVFLPVSIIFLKIALLWRNETIAITRVMAITVDNDRIFYLSAAFLLMYLYVIGWDFSSPRESYENLAEKNRSGSFAKTGITLLFLYLNSSVMTIKRLFTASFVVAFIGSKGMVLSLFISFSIFQLLRGNASVLKIGLVAGLFLLFFSFVISQYTSGISSIFEYYLYSYFDHVENFALIFDLLGLFPLIHAIAWLNDLIPGFSRLAGVMKNDFHVEYFSYAMSFGKAPGMLFYEDLFRLGIIGYVFGSILELVYQVAILKVLVKLNQPTLARMAYIGGNFRLVFLLCFPYVLYRIFLVVVRRVGFKAVM